MTDSPTVDALTRSVHRLHELVAPLTDDQLATSAFPTEWSVADTLSHLGSGATIALRRLDDTLAGVDTPDDANQSVWDEWNAKSPRAQADDTLVADAAFIDRLTALSAAERASVITPMGPLMLDFETYLGLRVNEHTLHTWDVDVAFDPAAVLPAFETAVVFDRLELIGGFVARPTGDTRTIRIDTVAPDRRFIIGLTPEAATLGVDLDAAGDADLRLPGEAFARLVYGRLDPDHTPPVDDGGVLEVLRRVFPGM